MQTGHDVLVSVSCSKETHVSSTLTLHSQLKRSWRETVKESRDGNQQETQTAYDFSWCLGFHPGPHWLKGSLSLSPLQLTPATVDLLFPMSTECLITLLLSLQNGWWWSSYLFNWQSSCTVAKRSYWLLWQTTAAVASRNGEWIGHDQHHLRDGPFYDYYFFRL